MKHTSHPAHAGCLHTPVIPMKPLEGVSYHPHFTDKTTKTMKDELNNDLKTHVEEMTRYSGGPSGPAIFHTILIGCVTSAYCPQCHDCLNILTQF